MASIELENVTKKFGETVAVKSVDLRIEDGDFVVLLGPSGCGKTTTLRLIAGLEESTEGNILLEDKIINDLDPGARDVAMVFQSYAIYPHMNAFENMAFPLEMEGIPEEEREERVREAARTMDIEELLDKEPRHMSGGQRQRVALGRAIVRKPVAFLMDEPLANLDARLRIRMRAELKKLHERLGVTTVYVTHDQTEAMTMADKVALMKDGKIQQYSHPDELYDNPNNTFVGEFVGDIPINFIEGVAELKDAALVVETDFFKAEFDDSDIIESFREKSQGPDVLLGVRGEDIGVGESGGSISFEGEIYITESLGNKYILNVKLREEKIIKVEAPKTISPPESGESITISVSKDSLHIFDKKTTEAMV